MYNGHSVLGTGMAFERAQYPDFYQIFQVASCLSYEYYVRPVLAGKGDWSKVEVISNVEPTYYSENLPLTSTILAKLMWGFENEGRASWQDIMEAVSRKLGHYRFGVSGARGNCFDPEGNRCDPEPPPDPDTLIYENTSAVEIPDNNPQGAASVIDVPDSVTIGSVEVEINLTHTYVGDLKITVKHNEASEVIWNRSGGSNDDIRANFQLSAFDGSDSAGTWSLEIVDLAGADTGKLNKWTLRITPSTGPGPDPDKLRYENNHHTTIPDNNASGQSSIIEVPDQVNVAGLSIEIDITHTYIGDLFIVLSHNGRDHVLWNREGGSGDDLRKTFSMTAFNDMDASGVWTLTVSDRASRDTGTLNNWALVITPGSDPDPNQVEYENTTPAGIPDNDPTGITSVIDVPDRINIGSLSVKIDITHTYIGDLRIILSHNGTDHVLWDRQGGGASNIQQTFTPSDFNDSDASGNWTLRVVDLASRDTGTLNSWALVITPSN